jgi:hypothetical protein
MKVTTATRARSVESGATSGEVGASPPTFPGVLPAPSVALDPLAAIYATLLKQQNEGASIDSARTKQDGVERHADLVKQQKEQAEEQTGGRGFCGAIFHLLGDTLKDYVECDFYDFAKDSINDTSKDMINNPKFWDQLKTVAEVTGMAVAGAASIVATGGTSAPVLIAVGLSAAAMIDSKAHILQSLGVKANVAGFIDAGAGIAGAAVTMGASLGSTAGEAGELADKAQTAAKVVSATSMAVEGTATVAGGVIALHAATVEKDAAQAGMQAKKLQQMIDWVVAGMKEQEKGTERALNTVSQTIKTRDDTSVSLSSLGKA